MIRIALSKYIKIHTTKTHKAVEKAKMRKREREREGGGRNDIFGKIEILLASLY